MSTGAESVRAEPTADWLREQYVVHGRSAAQIAGLCGWSAQYVRDRLTDAGVAFRRLQGNAANGGVLDDTVLTAMVAEGLSAAQIASRTGYSRAGVYKRLRRVGLTVQRTEDRAVVEEVRRLYEGGSSVNQIGKLLGHGQKWVIQQLRAEGVKLRRERSGPHRTLDPARVRQLISEGCTVPQIAALTDRAPATIYALVSAHGWTATSPPRRPRVPPLDAVLVRRLYVDDRVSMGRIAEQLHCDTSRVRAVLTGEGVPIRLPGRRDDDRPAPITAAQLQELYVEGDLTINEVARRLGCSSTRVAAALTRLKIPRHPDPRRRHRVPTVDIDADTLMSLYVDQKLDDITIASRYDVPPVRIRHRRRELGIRRPAATPPRSEPPPSPPAEQLEQLYLVENLPLEVIARRYHTSTRVVRGWLTAGGIPVQPRTSRSDRRQLDPIMLRERYEEQQWTAAQIAVEQHTTVQLVLRALHENGIPVRRGGFRPHADPYLLLDDLYDDPDVLALLQRHHIPVRPQHGPIASRFPQPVPLNATLLRQAYLDIGLSARHIELVTGQPAEQILDALHAAAIPVRTIDGTPSPWLARHHQP
ncbi:MAG: hypothetical protein ABI083_10835 [Lapillicoccus sp.]